MQRVNGKHRILTSVTLWIRRCLGRTLVSSKRRHFDRFSRLCTAHPCNKHTDRQTTLRATSIAKGSIYALPVCDEA